MFYAGNSEQVNNCEAEGVLPTITGIMGTLQANEGKFNT